PVEEHPKPDTNNPERSSDVAEPFLQRGVCVLKRLNVIVCCLILAAASRAFTAEIHTAAAKGDTAKVESIIGSNAASLNEQDGTGATPLHYAVAAGQKAVVKLLISNTADVNAAKKDGVRPLHVAAATGNLDLAKLLVEAGAEVNAKDGKGRTAFDIAKSGGETDVAAYLVSLKSTDPESAASPTAADGGLGATWLDKYQRLCFGVDMKNLDQVVKDGVNVVCGGTNAGGIGFAGGPFVIGKNGEIVDVQSGDPVPEKTIKELRANVDAAHAKGVKVLGEVIRMHMTPWVQAEHPDWQVLNSPGEKPITAEKVKQSGVSGCWNSPYGDFFIQSQVELVKRLDWDGYNLDGFGCWMQCFCVHCTEDYKKDSGKDIPGYTNVNDTEWRHYLKWKLNRYTQFVKKWTLALKAVKPGFVAAPWTTGPGRWWHWMGAPAVEGTDEMHRMLDAPFLELLWDFPPDQGSNLLPAFTCRYYRGLTGDKPAWILPYLCEQGQFNMQPPLAECDVRNMTVLTNGCLVSAGSWAQNKTASLAHFEKTLSDREPFTTGAKSLKWAAMFVGESSRVLYGLPGARVEVPLGKWFGSGVDTPDIGKLAPGERRMPAHMESAVGVFRAMMEDHLPLDIIIESDLENLATLKQYKVLILPNAACLSDKALGNIRTFVNEGRGLVAMHESSICNEFGDRKDDFGLADVFGAHFKGTEDNTARWPNYPSWLELYLGLVKPDLHEICDDPVVWGNYRSKGSDYGNGRLNYIGWCTNVDNITVGTVKVGRRLTTPIEWPFLLVRDYGNGRSAYYAADIGQAYFIAPYQYQRKLISNAVKWAAGVNSSPVKVVAPLCVQAAFYTQKEGKRTIVHLLNENNTTADRALPENNPSMREEIVPMIDIKVSFNNPNVISAFQEPGHIALPMTKTAAGVEVTVPRLDVHSMVVFE
ncbi:MAG: ankyrin repeat domain-containing protein, partial [Armatimonadota bacterium]